MTMKVVKHECELKQDGLKSNIKIVIDAEEVNRLIKWKHASFKSKANMKGYRAGKVPMHVIVQKYGLSLSNELTQDLISKLGEDAIKNHQLDPIGRPDVKAEVHLVEGDKDYEFSMNFECYPKIPEHNASDLTVSTVACNIDASDVDNVIKELESQSIEWNPVSREVAPGDQVTVKYLLGMKDGSSDGSAPEVTINMTSSLEESVASMLLGASVGDDKMIDASGLAAWLPLLRGPQDDDQDGNIDNIGLHITEICESKAVALSKDTWAGKGYAAEDVDALKEEIMKDLELDAKVLSEDVNYDVLRPMIIHALEFDLPSGPVADELKRLESLDSKTDMSLPQLAAENVKLSLILREVLTSTNISVDQARVVEYVKSKSAVKGYYRALYAQYMLQQEQAANYWSMQVLERQLLDSILDQADKVVENITWSELKSRAVSE